MEIILLPEAENHLNFWKKTGNKKVLKKISELIKATIDSPYEGLGKPEALKYQLTGKWSRRIDQKNRFVYMVTDKYLYVYSLKGHY
ncbi:MAG: Txe/YoeB family addiction module toxin [Bacteroidetes bacterium]|nr:MAG: Txe/YoeB family addiction module toxin [Bacteroidota bacterium]